MTGEETLEVLYIKIKININKMLLMGIRHTPLRPKWIVLIHKWITPPIAVHVSHNKQMLLNYTVISKTKQTFEFNNMLSDLSYFYQTLQDLGVCPACYLSYLFGLSTDLLSCVYNSDIKLVGIVTHYFGSFC